VARWGKVPAIVKDTPGFIVNRVARSYYLESLRCVEEGAADIAAIDRLMEAQGFKMGPFRLMDLIGVETNHAVSRTVWEANFQPAHLKPSVLQHQKVDAGHFGRKTGKGFYNYEQTE
jgi:3-hydroxybutyryl-CoA dehydrogenase